ncbi:MAG TPA: BON domain-containing protein [Fibrobacteraceae bacterium]|nr:BON domain-containing protein [Fibrobacteraceae bacterium]
MFLHSLKAREPLYTGVAAPSREPILATCHHCRQSLIYVADEFRDFSAPPLEGSLCKIAGRSRLQVKDTVYIPGASCVGRIKSRFRSGHQESFVISMESGEEERWSPAAQMTYGENALEGYRLLPTSAAETRIGDLVYHVTREKFGRAVGLLYGRETRLVVQFEDEGLLLVTLPEYRNIPENRILVQEAREWVSHHLPYSLDRISLDAGQGVVYVRGTCSSLPEAEELRQGLRQLPLARGAVDLLVVEPTRQISDEALSAQVWHTLMQPGIGLLGVRLQCSQGQVAISAFYREEPARIRARQLISAIPGIRDLHLELRLRPMEESPIQDRVRAVAQAMRRNSSLHGARIRVYSLEGAIYLEGFVISGLQRNAASLAAMWAGRNFLVDNQLQIVSNTKNPSDLPVILEA